MPPSPPGHPLSTAIPRSTAPGRPLSTLEATKSVGRSSPRLEYLRGGTVEGQDTDDGTCTAFWVRTASGLTWSTRVCELSTRVCELSTRVCELPTHTLVMAPSLPSVAMAASVGDSSLAVLLSYCDIGSSSAHSETLAASRAEARIIG